MIKKIVWLILLVFSLSFIACNNSNPTNELPNNTSDIPDEEETNKEYKVTLNYQNGKKSDILVFEESKFPELNVPEKAHYVFVGWFENDILVESINENRDYNLIAKWDKEKYVIKFYVLDKVVSEETYEYGQSITSPEVQDFELDDSYYEFESWDKEFSLAISDLEIHANLIESKMCTVNLFYNEKLIKTEHYKEYSRVPDLDVSLLNDEKFTYTVHSIYLDKELTSKFTEHFIKTNLDLHLKLLIKPKRSGYTGLTISIIGDSISTFYSPNSEINSYYGGDNQFFYPRYSVTVKDVKKTWWYLTADKLGCKLGINNSWSGSTCFNNGSETNSGAMNYNRINTLGENGTPDIIIVFIGTNDIGNGYSDYENKYGYNTMLKRINEKYPNAYVFCLTLAYTGSTVYSYNEEGRVKYNEMIKEVVKKHNAFVIDWSSYVSTADGKSYLEDSLHYNATGMEKLSEALSYEIKQFFEKGIVK